MAIKKICKNGLSALMVLALLIAGPAAAVLIPTDTSWRSFDSEQSGWDDVGFDDSLWRSAHDKGASQHPPAEYTYLVDAKTIWDLPSDTEPFPLKSFLRLEFDLTSAVESASFEYAVDDAMILYINGEVAYTHVGDGSTNVAGLRTLDASLFNIGVNVLAFEAWDGDSGGVYNRGGEGITASFLIETTEIPEPAGLLLFGSGLVGLYAIRRRLNA